jgi:hypothetical protein
MASPKHPSLDQSTSSEPTEVPKKSFTEQLGDDAFEHLRRYQVITMPPGARAELMAAQLPLEPPELLEDTVPPHQSLAAPRVPSSSAPTAVEHERAEDVPTARKIRQRRLQALVIAVVVATASLAVLALAGRRATEQGEDPGVSESNGSPLPVAPSTVVATPTPAARASSSVPPSPALGPLNAAPAPPSAASTTAPRPIAPIAARSARSTEKATMPERKSATASPGEPKGKLSSPTTSVFDSAFVPPAN